MKLGYSFLGVFAFIAVLGLRPSLHSEDTPRPASTAKAAPDATFQKDVLSFLSQHCYSCHGNGKRRGELALDQYKDEQSLIKDRKVWESVIQMVRSGEMPPKEKKQRPSNAEIQAALLAIDNVLAKFDCSGPHNVGRVTVRRLNRVEYNNTIRDLVGIDFKPASDFPNDDVGYGFDNIGDVLSLSPLLLEKYLSAAETIVERAVVILDPPQPKKQNFNRGSLRPTFGAGDTRRGFGIFLNARGEVFLNNYFDEGDYTIRVEAFGQQAGTDPVRMALRVNGTQIQEFDVKEEQGTAKFFEAKTHIKGGSSRISAAFLNPYQDPKSEDPKKKERQLVVRSFEVDGPYNAPPLTLPETHQKIMAHAAKADDRAAAREILTRFANRAFRRPVKTDEVDRLLNLYDTAKKENERFEKCIRIALEGVLVSPHFLFRIENDPRDIKPETTYPISDFELASRLSYFLWSSMPDDELLELAGRGQLRSQLDVQVKRLLKDPKSASFVQNFAGQWLTIRNLNAIAPDAKLFPSFDDDLRTCMQRETELFFEAIMRENRSILEFIDSDYSFVNQRLAKHYGITGVEGNEFRRVSLPPGRGGILTQASILTITSNPTRTSPVKRGKWILEQILGTPPPPPPPDAGDLKDDANAQLSGSLRQRMEQHRTNPNCAVCHNRMDPIGFAFENYDATGAFRTKDGKFDIDPAGVLPDGRAFKGPDELKIILKTQKDLFGRCLAEKMLTYALGRGLEYYDKCSLDKILTNLAKDDYRFTTLILEVVKSEPFLMRTATAKTTKNQ